MWMVELDVRILLDNPSVRFLFLDLAMDENFRALFRRKYNSNARFVRFISFRGKDTESTQKLIEQCMAENSIASYAK